MSQTWRVRFNVALSPELVSCGMLVPAVGTGPSISGPVCYGAFCFLLGQALNPWALPLTCGWAEGLLSPELFPSSADGAARGLQPEGAQR